MCMCHHSENFIGLWCQVMPQGWGGRYPWKLNDWWCVNYGLPAGRGRYPYRDDLLQLDACCPTDLVILPHVLRMVETPLNWREWDIGLASHPDQCF